MTKPKKVLIAPLNWGLGHATRCIPLINEFQRQGAEVILASDGAALQLLKSEYPHLTCHELPPYDIRYPFDSMVLSIMVQMPKILRGCVNEHIWLNNFLKKNKVDVVISDNRFGFYNKQVHSIFMTHQINILTPFQTIVNQINHYFIKKFDACWIPDYENPPTLAGKLSHPTSKNTLQVTYIGALSRLKKQAVEKKYKAIFVLSGPEPQRTKLEKIILQQLQSQVLSSQNELQDQYCLVRGVTTKDVLDDNYKNIDIHNYLTTKDLNQKIAESEFMVARSGYSTIMDLAALGMNALLIPTPGQTEQEYLAYELMRNKVFYSQTQAEMDLQQAFTEMKNYRGYVNFFNNENTLFKIISQLLKN